MCTALNEGLPLYQVKKQGDAVSAAVICSHKSGGSSLNHFELGGQLFSVGPRQWMHTLRWGAHKSYRLLLVCHSSVDVSCHLVRFLDRHSTVVAN